MEDRHSRSKGYLIATFLAAILIMSGVLYLSSLTGDTESTGEQITAARPENVPADAVFRGGSDGGFFVALSERPLKLSDGHQLPAYDMVIYLSFSGDEEYRGIGLYIPPREVTSEGQSVFLPAPSVEEILQTAYYSFGALEFPVEGSASKGRIVPYPLE